MSELFEDVADSVDRYSRRVDTYAEKWKKDHDDAMMCLGLEEAIAFGLCIYNHINRLDEIWRLGVLSKKVPFRADVDLFITKAFRQWLTGSKKLAKIVKKLENLKYEVTGVVEFHSACREVEGVLTDDATFFGADKLPAMEASAIQSHRTGQTEEMESISD